MALRVWLPLDGDLRNLGTSNYNISVFRGSEVYDNNGKIGKCFNANGVNTLKISNIISDFYNYTSYSLCAWCYCTAQNTVHPGSAIISGGDWNHQVLNLAMSDWSTDHYTHLRISGTNWSRTYYYNFNLNTWYHIIVSCDGNKTYAYVNGNIIGDTADSFLPTSISGNDICIGGATYYAGMQFFGKINDVRIYDHCLSAAEVREIAQGLVLHYKLDGPMGGSGINLMLNTNAEKGTIYWGNWATATNRSVVTLNGKKWFHFTASAGASAYGGFYQDNVTTSNQLVIKPNTNYTISALMFASDDTKCRFWYHVRSTEGGANISQGAGNITVTSTPQRYSYTFNSGSNSTYTINRLNMMIGAAYESSTDHEVYFTEVKLEEGTNSTPWTPAPSEMGIDTTKIEDSSGYGHNGEIISELHTSNDTARYNNSTLFDGVDDCIIVPYNTVCPENIFTINLWFKKDAIGTKSYETLFGGPNGFEMDTRAGGATSLSLYMASSRSGNRNAITPLTLGNWYMITMTRDETKEKYYVNGIFQSEIDAKSMPTGVYRIGAWASNDKQNYYGLISDFRIYCTPLLDTDIKQLYNVSMKVDNLGGVHGYEFIEQQSNMIFPIELSRSNLQFTNGLSKYTQANCQVTLTDQGYHIYRPPNLTLANDGSTMWGGLKLVNQKTDGIATYDDNRDNNWGLQKGHTYFAAFHAKGKSSNSASWAWSNNMGWSGGGINASPTIIINTGIPSNFQGEKDCIFIFTINDDIAKNCTSAYSSYVVGTTYLSYRHLAFNWVYGSTGELGTDLYLTNFRLYDITDQISQIKKTGVINFSSLVEQTNKAQIRKNSELLATEFIEM